MFKRIRRVLVLAVFFCWRYKAYRSSKDETSLNLSTHGMREILSEKDTPANEELVLANLY